MGFFADLFFGRPSEKSLRAQIEAVTLVKVHDTFFRIKKISNLDYMRGAKVYMAFFETYEKAAIQEKMKIAVDKEKSLEKVQDHFCDVFMSAIVEPRICYDKDREKSPGAVPVSHLCTDMQFAHDLYLAIIEHSFGKKKSI